MGTTLCTWYEQATVAQPMKLKASHLTVSFPLFLFVAQTLAPDLGDDYARGNLSEQQYCSLKFEPDNTAPASIPAKDNIAFRLDNIKLQYRDVFCVFDTK